MCGESRTHGDNGGDGKTQYGCASCPYPLGAALTDLRPLGNGGRMGALPAGVAASSHTATSSRREIF